MADASTPRRFGFIGLGVMGEPMCRNLARKGFGDVVGHDRDPAPLQRLAAFGVAAAATIAEVVERSDVIFLALPSGAHVEAVCDGPQGLLSRTGPRHVVVDLGTSPVDLTRALAGRFAARGVRYADAPIARTRQAAEDGTLSIMVGADATTFAAVEPLLRAFATDITHCGPVGSGQVVKIMNNMVLVQTVVALAEALATARRAGVDGKVLFDALMKGSADSFALRNHGAKAMLVDNFPERAFSTRYALKDIDYALELARALGLDLAGAENAAGVLRRTADGGAADLYWPVIYRTIANPDGPAR
ncbi:MAG: NAD(P)-dependent oxidoreductase [Xanthobacteraceae bacterium]